MALVPFILLAVLNFKLYRKIKVCFSWFSQTFTSMKMRTITILGLPKEPYPRCQFCVKWMYLLIHMAVNMTYQDHQGLLRLWIDLQDSCDVWVLCSSHTSCFFFHGSKDSGDRSQKTSARQKRDQKIASLLVLIVIVFGCCNMVRVVKGKIYNVWLLGASRDQHLWSVHGGSLRPKCRLANMVHTLFIIIQF